MLSILQRRDVRSPLKLHTLRAELELEHYGRESLVSLIFRELSKPVIAFFYFSLMGLESSEIQPFSEVVLSHSGEPSIRQGKRHVHADSKTAGRLDEIFKCPAHVDHRIPEAGTAPPPPAGVLRGFGPLSRTRGHRRDGVWMGMHMTLLGGGVPGQLWGGDRHIEILPTAIESKSKRRRGHAGIPRRTWNCGVQQGR